MSLLDEEAKIVTSRLGTGRFRIAGTAEYNGINRDIRADRIQPLIDWSRRNFHQVGTYRVVPWAGLDRKSTRLNSSHVAISYAVFCLKKKSKNTVTEKEIEYNNERCIQ